MLGPGVTAVERRELYWIEAPDLATLQQRLRQISPLSEDGRYDFGTRWYLRWRWPSTREVGRGCRLDSVSVDVDIAYTEPCWENANASAEERRRWNDYVERTRVHERGHAQFGLRAAVEIAKALATPRPQATCEAMELLANQRAHQILERHAKLNRQYDLDTDHGHKQGAEL